jgi:Spy/CpxP family protein refolding chaperone
MKRDSKQNLTMTLSIACILLATCATAFAQTTQPQSLAEPLPSQAQNTQAAQAPDFRLLNLTPDQIQKIRAINFDLKDERQAANLKLRQAQRALAEAVESPTPDEALIAQRSRDVADAQATTIRLRSLTEARILQVLTPEQRVKLKEIREQNQALIRERNQELKRTGNQQLPRNGLGRRQQGLPRNANQTAAPGTNQRKIMQPKPKP